MNFGLLYSFCPHMTIWLLMFHIWLLDFHTLHFVLSWQYIIKFHMMMRHDTWTCIDHYEDTCTCYNLTMTTWTSWWGGNANLSSSLLHLAFLMINMIYASYSCEVFFVAYLHPLNGLWSLSQSFEPSCNVFFLSWSMICFMASCFCLLFFIFAGVSLWFLLFIYLSIYLS